MSRSSSASVRFADGRPFSSTSATSTPVRPSKRPFCPPAPRRPSRHPLLDDEAAVASTDEDESDEEESSSEGESVGSGDDSADDLSEDRDLYVDVEGCFSTVFMTSDPDQRLSRRARLVRSLSHDVCLRQKFTEVHALVSAIGRRNGGRSLPELSDDGFFSGSTPVYAMPGQLGRAMRMHCPHNASGGGCCDRCRLVQLDLLTAAMELRDVRHGQRKRARLEPSPSQIEREIEESAAKVSTPSTPSPSEVLAKSYELAPPTQEVVDLVEDSQAS